MVDFAQALRIIGEVAANHRTQAQRLALPRTHGRILAADIVDPRSRVARDESGAEVPGERSAAAGPVLLAGRLLTPARVAMAASLGLGSLTVARRPTVAVFIIGDGLAEPGMPLAQGQTHDSQRELLMGLLRADGLEPTGWPVLAGDRRQVEIALRDAGCAFDLIVACEAAGMQPDGCVDAVLVEFGQLHFRGVRMEPGESTRFGSLDEARVLALPPDAVSLQVAWLALGRALIDGLQGRAEARPRWRARLSLAVDRPDAPCAFLPACVYTDERGALIARPITPADTGELQAIAEANAVIVLPQQPRRLEAGTLVEVIGCG